MRGKDDCLSILDDCIMADLVDEVQLRTVGSSLSTHSDMRHDDSSFLVGRRSENRFGLQSRTNN